MKKTRSRNPSNPQHARQQNSRQQNSRQQNVRQQTLRIIGGQWRSRQLPFAAVEGLRPTMDRVRETLFNWLQFDIHGRNCLDLFAGSGALGLEALSRGAAHVDFVEKSPLAARAIGRALSTLQCKAGDISETDALRFLAGPVRKPFDIVFLDPPFRQGLLGECCTLLEDRNWLEPGCIIYIEQEKENPPPEIPETWHQIKEKAAGQVRMSLFRR